MFPSDLRASATLPVNHGYLCRQFQNLKRKRGWKSEPRLVVEEKRRNTWEGEKRKQESEKGKAKVWNLLASLDQFDPSSTASGKVSFRKLLREWPSAMPSTTWLYLLTAHKFELLVRFGVRIRPTRPFKFQSLISRVGGAISKLPTKEKLVCIDPPWEPIKHKTLGSSLWLVAVQIERD